VKRISLFPLALIVAEVCLIGMLAGFFYIKKIPFDQGLNLFLSFIFNPDTDFRLFQTLTLRYIFFAGMGLVFLFILFICRFAGKRIRNAPEKMVDKALMAVVCVYLLTLFFQTFGQMHYLLIRRPVFRLTTAQKYSLMVGPIFHYPIMARQILPQGRRYTCQLMTDIDTYRDPGMLKHRMLSYFLYPVDLRQIRREPVNCVFAFQKEDAVHCVPGNYEIIKQWDDRHLLAVSHTLP